MSKDMPPNLLSEFLKNTGGPAFPTHMANGGGPVFDGMTLRDFFAASAIIGILSEGGHSATSAADLAYNVADRMLRRRLEKGKE